MCHNDNGVASATRLQFPPEDASAEEITRFGLRLKLVRSRRCRSIFAVRKPTERISHTGGERIHPGTSEEKRCTRGSSTWRARNPELTREQKRVVRRSAPPDRRANTITPCGTCSEIKPGPPTSFRARISSTGSRTRRKSKAFHPFSPKPITALPKKPPAPPFSAGYARPDSLQARRSRRCRMPRGILFASSGIAHSGDL